MSLCADSIPATAVDPVNSQAVSDKPLPPWNTGDSIPEGGLKCFRCTKYSAKTWVGMVAHLKTSHQYKLKDLVGTYTHTQSRQELKTYEKTHRDKVASRASLKNLRKADRPEQGKGNAHALCSTSGIVWKKTMCWVAFSEAGDVLSPFCCAGVEDADGHPPPLEDIAQRGVKRPQPIACGASSASTEQRGPVGEPEAQPVGQLTRPIAEDGRTQLSAVGAAERPTGKDVASTLAVQVSQMHTWNASSPK